MKDIHIKVLEAEHRFCKIMHQTYFLPTITRTASCMSSRARSSTKSGKVALNSERIIEGFEQALIIESICLNNSGSNSLSDSSRTRYSTLQRQKKISNKRCCLSTIDCNHKVKSIMPSELTCVYSRLNTKNNWPDFKNSILDQ